LPLKNKTNKLFHPFICCRLGRSRIEKKKKTREKERKVSEKHKKKIQRKKIKKVRE
jgi:predicted transcriptional regulator